MGLGNGNAKQGDRGSNHNYEHRSLLSLGNIANALLPLTGLATEATLISVLNAIISTPQDVEILLVRDTGNGNVVLQQITDYSGGNPPVVTYKDVNGNVVVPVGPLEYLDPASVLNLILSELQTLNTVDFATQTTLAALLTELQLKADLSETQPVSLATAQKTASLTRISGIANSSVAAGARSVSFFNAGSTDATVAGGTLKPGESVDFSAGGQNDTLAAIPYVTIATGDLVITSVI